MTHCGDCGIALVSSHGIWEHDPSPDNMDPAECVLGVTDGVPYGSPGCTAYPCLDPLCREVPGDPWWAEHVKAKA